MYGFICQFHLTIRDVEDMNKDLSCFPWYIYVAFGGRNIQERGKKYIYELFPLFIQMAKQLILFSYFLTPQSLVSIPSTGTEYNQYHAHLKIIVLLMEPIFKLSFELKWPSNNFRTTDLLKPCCNNLLIYSIQIFSCFSTNCTVNGVGYHCMSLILKKKLVENLQV